MPIARLAAFSFCVTGSIGLNFDPATPRQRNALFAYLSVAAGMDRYCTNA
ncbi:hypothetical protein APX70_200185 [Pseudomonas syringae pv. maculicola]|uniref:Uncharacterized protein n=1 Tax=Pseudomonas syringae pv. maculicola TaxID=59511 RepID=A0A3M3AWI7_PSEYM|nr:hypothetical protein APX70_200185 [Pseudomonas syringae pv. maculicola]